MRGLQHHYAFLISWKHSRGSETVGALKTLNVFMEMSFVV
jgi:hypothetical protein